MDAHLEYVADHTNPKGDISDRYHDMAQALSIYLQSGTDTPKGTELVIRAEKARLGEGIKDQIAWLSSPGIVDENQILNYLSIAPATDILAQQSLIGAPSADIIAAVQKYGAQYDISPQILLDIIAFETGGTFDPNSKNKAGRKGYFK